MNKLITFSAATLLAILTGCTTVPESGRRALNIVPDEMLAESALTAFAKMKKDTPVSTNPAYNARLQRVGERIAVQVERYLPDTRWEFVVFASEDVNAFAMPGGKVGFYEGIFELFESDDDIAVVMGHEIAHVIAKHGNERVSQAMIVGLGGVAIGVAANDDDVEKYLAIYGATTSLGVILPYSRFHESEADAIGLSLAARAGYNPEVALGFWQRMAEHGGPRPPAILSTHPAPAKRIERLRELMPAAIAEYRAAIANGR